MNNVETNSPMGHIRNDNLLRVFDKVDDFIDARFHTWCGWRRHLHAHPELSWEEVQTTAFIREQLESLGLTLKRGPRDLGGFVDLKSADANGSMFAVRGDIDAIPVREATELEFRSQNEGVMHACGHDVHATMALAVCDTIQHLVNERLNIAPVNVRVIFQPAEEVATGALEMIKVGALKNVERIVAMHVDSSREVGSIGLKDGVQTASCEEVRVHFNGEGGHSARPFETADPVFAAAHFMNAAYASIPRIADARRSEVLTFCHIAGGQFPNVIPGTVSLRGTFRTFDQDTRSRVKRQLEHLADATHHVTGVQVEIEYGIANPPVDNCPETNELLRIAAETFLADNDITKVEASLGAEDFACYLQKIPGAFVRIGSACGDHGRAHLHSPHFDVDESVIKVAVGLFARTILQWGHAAS